MMSLPHSSSENLSLSSEESKAFKLLDERIQRWIWQQQWNELRDIQEQAIEAILSAEQDVIIASPTASGKTEAAFFPILTRVLQTPSKNSISVAYIGPLKALINDQFERLDLLCEHLEVPVWRWHGDVPGSQKKNLLKEPKGILLITPESLEALFVNHGTRIPSLFSQLKYVVIDELHSFIGTERGRQLQSLLHRLEIVVGRRIPRVALSATLGEMSLAKVFLRTDSSMPCALIKSNQSQQEIKIQIRGYLMKSIQGSLVGKAEEQNVRNDIGDRVEIARDLYRALRGTTNLIFTNRRSEVEIYGDLLRRMCEDSAVPNEFWPHHGSLSKELREDLEKMVKDKSRPTNVLCTSTLEMGIDIGSVTSTAQIGTPPSVSSLRQRLGRSGRRGQPAILRIYEQEEEITQHTAPQDRLRSDLVQSIAMFELLLEGWYEPPFDEKLHLSTLVQQMLSMIAQYGGVRVATAWQLLCGSGPFRAVDKPTYAKFLRALGTHDIIVQNSEGLLLLGTRGERIVNHYSFYTAFMTPEEYQLTTQDGKIIGTLPIDYPLIQGSFLIFAGRRWEVVEVEASRKIVVLKPSKGGKPPKFGGSGKSVHDKVRQKMFNIYCSEMIPPYIDTGAKALLREGQSYFSMMRLGERRLVNHNNGVLVFPWRGDRVMNTLAVQLIADGFRVTMEGIALHVLNIEVEHLLDYFKKLPLTKLRTAIELATVVKNKISEKYDPLLTEELLNVDYASGNIALFDTAEVIKEIINSVDS